MYLHQPYRLSVSIGSFGLDESRCWHADHLPPDTWFPTNAKWRFDEDGTFAPTRAVMRLRNHSLKNISLPLISQ